MNGEKIGIWKEAVVAYFKVLFRYSLERVTNTTKKFRVSDNVAKIRIHCSSLCCSSYLGSVGKTQLIRQYKC